MKSEYPTPTYQRFVIDTEFAESPERIELISIGIVCDDGRHYYAESADFSGDCNDWVSENVVPHLNGPSKPKEVIAEEIREFMGECPEIWAYYGDYDWVVLCQLYGTMIDLPETWPMLCLDLQQRFLAGNYPPSVKPVPPSDEHHAEADAEWGIDFLNAMDEWDRTPSLWERIKGFVLGR